jgi:hypothetical protein
VVANHKTRPKGDRLNRPFFGEKGEFPAKMRVRKIRRFFAKLRENNFCKNKVSQMKKAYHRQR